MNVNHSTTIDQYIAGTGCWQDISSTEKANLATAMAYFVRVVPLGVLNRPDTSSPWGPGQGGRTQLYSWLQAISKGHPVKPDRWIQKNQRLKQYRFKGDPMNWQGHWFTWESTRVDQLALPNGQTAVRIFRVIEPLSCLQSTASDAFAGWVDERRDVPFADYRHGGGAQFFIYNDHKQRSKLELVGGAK